MRRRDLLAGAAVLGAPSLLRAQPRRVLRFIPQADLAVLDPIINTATVTRNHAYMIFDTLYGQNERGEPVPEMVAGHRVDDDGRRWTMTLRDGLSFHDGTPVRATDCVASIRRWAGRDSFGKMLATVIDDIAAPDDRTLVFRLRRPFPMLPAALAKTVPVAPVIMPSRVIPSDAGVAVTEMVGSGPFRFLAGERVPGARAVYERFAGYVPRPGGTPGLSAGPKIVHVDRVEWLTVPDAATAFAAIRNAEVDWWERPVPDLLPAARADHALNVATINPYGTIVALQFNHLVPPFDNPAIRRIVLSAINQKDVTEAIVGADPALSAVNVGIFLPGSPMASDAGLGLMRGRTDFDAIQRELQAAGYRNERVVMLAGTDSPVNNAASEVMAELLRHMGFNLDYVATDWGSVVRRRMNQQPVDAGGWCVYAVSADGDYFADPSVAPAIRANGRDAGVGWPTSPRIEQLFAAWFEAPDLAGRQAIARDLQLQTWQDVPNIPLGQVFLPTILRTDVTGVLPGFPKFWNLQKA